MQKLLYSMVVLTVVQGMTICAKDDEHVVEHERDQSSLSIKERMVALGKGLGCAAALGACAWSVKRLMLVEFWPIARGIIWTDNDYYALYTYCYPKPETRHGAEFDNMWHQAWQRLILRSMKLSVYSSIVGTAIYYNWKYKTPKKLVSNLKKSVS